MLKKYGVLLLFLSLMMFSCDSEKTDPCENVKCSGHGQCQEVNAQAKCACDDGYVANGLTCEVLQEVTCKADSCTEANKGVCTVENNQIVCSCDDGYYDEAGTCKENTITCQADSCTEANKGVCSVANNQIVCSCDANYYDNNGTCEPVVTCESDSCTEANKGVCTVENNQIVCSCDAGYYDEAGTCKENTVTCQADSCTEANKGVCAVVDNAITCSCDAGYVDNNGSCEPVVTCEQNSCTEANKGVCTVENNQIVCSCDAGYHDENGTCVEDQTPECNPACEAWETCNTVTGSGTPHCELKPNRCTTASDCESNEVCDMDSHFCYPAKKSWATMPSANGFGAILFNSNEKKLTTYYPHMYRQMDEHSPATPNLAYDVYFGVRVNGQNTWLNSVDVTDMEYIAGTGIIKVTRETTELTITEHYWMSMLSAAPIAVAGITVKNKTGADLNDVAVFTLGNFRVGTGDQNSNEEKADYKDDLNGFYERNWAFGHTFYQVFFMSGNGAPDVMATNEGDYNPWVEVNNNNLLAEHKTSGTTGKSDIALFYQKNLGTVASNTEKSYYVAWNSQFTNNGEDAETVATPIKNLITGKDFNQVLLDEQNYWSNWHAVETLPDNMTAREQRLAIQSSAFIKMGQLREDVNGYGQILASLPPGGWNISWIRDMSYAVVGMIKANHMTEAVDALEFIFGNKVNIGRYDTPDWDRLGHDYQISVCRYFANGDEETDWNSAGPNIEYDGFGLALWILDEYIQANNDNTEFLTQYQDNIFRKTADVLVNLIEPNGLIAPDSSIWEYHWTDDGYNGKRHFSYTSITAYRGLKAAERLGNLIGIDTTTYRDKAAALKTAIETHLVKDNVLTNFIESDVSPHAPENGQNLYNIDASSVEAFNFGVFDPDSTIATQTLAAYDTELGNLVSGSPGYKRTNKRCNHGHPSCVGTVGGALANDYDIKEWIMVDFRILNFLRRRTDEASQEKADQLYNWILTQTELNYYQIAELYHEQTGHYDGSIPMCGFGPGAYLIDLAER